MITPDVLEILCHPESREPLQLNDADSLTTRSGEAFPIIDGIPRLIPSQAPVSHRFWEWVYNRTAFAYDWGVAFAWRFRWGGQPIDRQTYLQKIDVRPGDFVLETAVGTGTNIQQLPPNARYVGLDISAKMLLQCQKNLTRWGRAAALVQGDAQFLPFQDNVFDVVYHMGGLQFISSPRKALTETIRVCKPGGRVWLIDEMYSIPGLMKRSNAWIHTPRTAYLDVLPDIVSSQATGICAESISNGELYLLSFRKKDEKII